MQHVCTKPNSFVVSVCVSTCARAVVVIVFTVRTFLGGDWGALSPIYSYLTSDFYQQHSNLWFLRDTCAISCFLATSCSGYTCGNLCQSLILPNIFPVVFTPVRAEKVFDGLIFLGRSVIIKINLEMKNLNLATKCHEI